MAEKDFKVKKGLLVGENADISGSLTADSATVTGTVTANAFVGDGSGLTGVTSYVESDFSEDFAAKSTSDLSEGSNLYYTKGRVDSDFDARFDSSFDERLGTKTTSNVAEGSNLYYTTARFDSDFNDNSTSDLSEGSNLYYTKARTDSDIDAAFTAKSTSNLSEGSNLYYTTARFDSDLGASTTSDLSEGTNKYYTTARHDSDFDARLSGGTGVSVSSGEVSIGQSVGTTDNVTFADITADTVKSLNYIEFDGTAPSYAEGRLWYDSANGALAMYGDEADITLQIGQEQYLRVYNNTGSTIENGSAVFYTGMYNGTIPTVAKAIANNKVYARAVGVATHDIGNAEVGYVTVRGFVNGIDTSAYTEDSFLYVSADTAGALTSTSPTYPNFPHFMGACTVSDSADGQIYVQVYIQSFENIRIHNNLDIDNDVLIAGDLTVLGTTTSVGASSLNVADQFLYTQSGDAVADDYTFNGSGLDDAYVSGYFEGTTSTNYYVRIDGTGAQDTIEWSKDNFSTTEATGLAITAGTPITLDNGFSIEFVAQTGHTSGDTWSWAASPVNLDTGFISHGVVDSEYTHFGLFRDNADNRWKFFKGYTPEITTAINTAHASYENADVQFGTAFGNLQGNVTGNVTGNASTATALATARNISISGDITANAISFNGTGNVALSASIDAGAVTNTMLAGSIADSKLSTISTAGKVSNSATTATDSDVANAIVARDANGDFSAGTITATAFVGDGSGLSGVTSYVRADFDSDFGSKSTSDLSEGTNQYFTTARARGVISAGGDLSYSAATGVVSFTERTDAQVRGLISAGGDLSYNSSTGVVSFTERTDAQVRALFSATGDLSYNSSTGQFSVSVPEGYATSDFDSDLGASTTSDLSEGTNLYYTSARARSAISVTDAGGYGSMQYNSGTGVLTYTGPSDADIRGRISASGDLSYNSSTGVMSFSETYSTATELLNALKTVDGASSGLDADTLDGQHGSYYRIDVYDASSTLLN